jgi:xylulokinase
MSLLGIDVGTTGCKSAVFSEDGSLIVIAYREYRRVLLPDGHAELNSQYVLNDLWDCIVEVADKTKKDPVTALSISSLG